MNSVNVSLSHIYIYFSISSKASTFTEFYILGYWKLETIQIHNTVWKTNSSRNIWKCNFRLHQILI